MAVGAVFDSSDSDTNDDDKCDVNGSDADFVPHHHNPNNIFRYTHHNTTPPTLNNLYIQYIHPKPNPDDECWAEPAQIPTDITPPNTNIPLPYLHNSQTPTDPTISLSPINVITSPTNTLAITLSPIKFNTPTLSPITLYPYIQHTFLDLSHINLNDTFVHTLDTHMNIPT